MLMNACRNLVVALGFVLAGADNTTAAGIDIGPVIVVPGRRGVPVMVNGQDVSGAVIEGDWGLGQPHSGLTIIRRLGISQRLVAYPRCPRRLRHVFHGPCREPFSGHRPWSAQVRTKSMPPVDRPLRHQPKTFSAAGGRIAGPSGRRAVVFHAVDRGRRRWQPPTWAAPAHDR